MKSLYIKEEKMSCYAGITTNPEKRKKEHQQKYKLSNWEQRDFSSREAAQAWEDKQTQCKHHPGGKDPNTWYGYRFDY